MNIFIIRHGEADNSTPDSSRRLTDQGKAKLIANIQIWKKKIPQFDYLIHSPVRRAEETAHLINDYFEVAHHRMEDEAIAPGSYTESILTLANSLEAENVAFVGHQPDCSMHISNLISNSGANVHFSPGTLAGIKFINSAKLSSGSLIYLIPG